MTDRPCPEFDADLSAHLDGELPAARRAEVEHHLARCKACARTRRRLENVSSVLHRWDAEETRYAHSHAFRNRVIDRVGGGKGVPSHAPSRVRTLERLVAAAALLGAAALGAVGASRLSSGDGPDVASRLDALSSELDQLRADVGRGASTGGDTAGADAGAAPALAPWEPVLGDAEPLAPFDSGTAATALEPVWERHGSLSILQEHVPELDRFENDRRLLALAQLVNESRERPRPEASTTIAAAPLPPLARFLGETEVRFGTGEAFREVQVWPVVIPAAAAKSGTAPLTANEAMRERVLRVKESAFQGMEEMVVLENRDQNRAVLVLSGDVFVGARQDRVAENDVLVPPGSTLSVRTLTSGKRRSGARSRTFSDAPGVAPLGLRGLLAAKSGQIGFDGAVGQVISDLASQNKSNSIEKLYSSNQLSNQMSTYLKHFAERLEAPDVVGFAVAIGPDVVGLEVFGDRATFESLYTRALRTYVLEALSRDRITGGPARDADVTALLAAARRGVVPEDTSSGSGRVAWIEDVASAAFGFGLLDVEGVVHAMVFPNRPAGAPGGIGGGRTGRGGTTTVPGLGGATDAPANHPTDQGSGTPTGGPDVNED